MKFDDFDDNATKWLYILIYLYIYMLLHNELMRGHVDLVMLRSTTGSYGRPVIKVAYGKMISSLYRDCMGDDSSGRVVEMLACCIAHAWHTRVNTSVGSTYIIFWFSLYKIYMYYVLKIYMYYKRNTGGFWRCFSPITFRERFYRPLRFLKKIIHKFIFVSCLSSWIHIWFMY